MRPYLNALRRHFGVVVVFSVVINILVMASPLYMLQLYDRVLASRSVETLIPLTAITAFLLLVMAALDVLRAKLLVRAGTVLHERIAMRLFDTVLQRTSSHPQEPSREAQKDLHDIRQFVSGNGLIALIDAPWAVVFMAIIFLMHPLLGAVAFVGAVALLIIATLAEFTTRAKLQDSRAATMRAEKSMNEGVRNADTLRVMGMVPAMGRIWRERQDHAVLSQDQVSDRLNTLTAMSKSIRLLLQMAMLGTGAWLALAQEITPGLMIAGSIIMARALAPVEQMLVAWRSLSAARRGYQRLDLLFTAVPETEPAMALPAPAAKLMVKALFGGPPGNTAPVVKSVNFGLGPGTVLGIVGPSAAGKSTLARLLVGAWPTLSGEVRLDGIDVGSLYSRDLGRYIGYLPQEVELFEGTVHENISRFSGGVSEATVRAAKLAGIHDMILQFPQGYDTTIGPKGVVLSGGQKQRIAMARAFYGDPVLIVMDEPDSHLDEAGQGALVRALRELKKDGRIVVVTTHRGTMMSAIDRLMVLRDGHVDLLGPTQDVLAKVRAGAASQKKKAPQRETIPEPPIVSADTPEPAQVPQ
ncbi:MAG: type I secretion system permease/ATPase [Magnetovibrio sp.]|nr:type I secretion system permease/ATPase [Magnetovibrio sp.]